nr:MAG TPA: hypothetical protein [Caudoviricetes sp.]
MMITIRSMLSPPLYMIIIPHYFEKVNLFFKINFIFYKKN